LIAVAADPKESHRCANRRQAGHQGDPKNPMLVFQSLHHAAKDSITAIGPRPARRFSSELSNLPIWNRGKPGYRTRKRFANTFAEAKTQNNDDSMTNLHSSSNRVFRHAQTRPEPKQTSKKILVVDDGKGPLRQYSLLLEEAGYDVTRAGGSLAALFAVARVEPDLVVAELRKPALNNLALAHELKTHHETSHVPVVVVSTKDTPKSRAAALKAGCDAFVAGNSDPDGFIREIARLLRADRPKRGSGFLKVIRARVRQLKASRQSYQAHKQSLTSALRRANGPFSC
jgi:PleD family two-component response regulator